MKILMLLIFFVVLTMCFAASISTTSKCPSMQSNPELQKLLNECVQHENATLPVQLSLETQKQVVCLLYLSSYNRACNKDVQIQQTSVVTYNMSTVCGNTDLLTEGIENLRTLIYSTFECRGVCLDVQKESTMAECSAAVYLNSILHSSIVEANAAKVAKDMGQDQNAVAPSQKHQEQIPAKKSNTNEVENPAQSAPQSPPASFVIKDVHPQQVNLSAHQIAEVKTVDAVAVIAPVAENKASPIAPVNRNKEEEVKPAKPLEQTEANGESDSQNGVLLPKNIAANDAQTSEKANQKQTQEQPPKQKLTAEQPQQQAEPQPNDHIDSPPLIDGEGNGEGLNIADNENPEDEKFESADDADEDVFEEQNEPKNKQIINVDDKTAAANTPQKPDKTYSNPLDSQNPVDSDSYFFSYFMMLCIIIVLFYVGYHNKQKIRAIVLEGPRGRRQYRSRRPNSANYHKLDSNLEEAITSSTANKSSSHVIY